MMDESHYQPKSIICNWQELLEAYEKQEEFHVRDGRSWIFRGENFDARSMKTSLERAVTNFDYSGEKIRELEAQIIHEFKRRSHHYLSDLPKKNDTLEWLALMQHYGAPTRLLDWTYSFYIAAFFAIEGGDEPPKDEKICVVWALNMNEYRTVKDRDNGSPDYSRGVMDFTRWKTQRDAVNRVFISPELRVMSVNPYRLNERLSIQQGTFLLPGKISNSFEENLLQDVSLKAKLFRFEFHVNIKNRKEMLLNLHRMNINRASLFPGLSGFAESLRTRLAFPDVMSTIQGR